MEACERMRLDSFPACHVTALTLCTFRVPWVPMHLMPPLRLIGPSKATIASDCLHVLFMRASSVSVLALEPALLAFRIVVLALSMSC